jgi:hypothetical protein
MRIKFLIFGVFSAFLLSGCKSPEEKVCLDILEKVVTSPDSTKVNSTDIDSDSDPLSGKSADEIYEWLTGESPSEAIRAGIDNKLKNGMVPTLTLISIDYTTDARIGKIRDEMVCVFSDIGFGQTLYSLSVQGKEFLKKDFVMLFVRIGRPDGLGSLDRVKK